MTQDIGEQPGALRRLLGEGRAAIDEVARAIRERRPRFVLLVARGTSDHAALYAKYLVEIRLGLPAGLASPSTLTLYNARPDLRDVLVLAVSQSGGSPDLTGSVQAARECGALTVAVTNNSESPLAEAAEFHVDVLSGHERAVAATKTYTSELLALYLLLEAVSDGDSSGAAALPELTEQLIADAAEPVAAVAPRYRFAEQLITTARGYAYCTAREAALKLMETCYLSAQAFSGADLLHGPLALVDREMPVIAVVARGRAESAMREVLDRLVAGGGDLLVVGDPDVIPAATHLPLPKVAEELSPILEIVPLQLLARDLAVARGGNPDAPRGLSKITETW
ncbi:MAG TPA: SIS domain-containing protein [Mycobacteriales bacterium]|nr:SIS domain-containing protein [Mycobacteriales bacterium]